MGKLTMHTLGHIVTTTTWHTNFLFNYCPHSLFFFPKSSSLQEAQLTQRSLSLEMAEGRIRDQSSQLVELQRRIAALDDLEEEEESEFAPPTARRVRSVPAIQYGVRQSLLVRCAISSFYILRFSWLLWSKWHPSSELRRFLSFFITCRYFLRK